MSSLHGGIRKGALHFSTREANEVGDRWLGGKLDASAVNGKRALCVRPLSRDRMPPRGCWHLPAARPRSLCDEGGSVVFTKRNERFHCIHPGAKRMERCRRGAGEWRSDCTASERWNSGTSVQDEVRLVNFGNEVSRNCWIAQKYVVDGQLLQLYFATNLS